MENIKEFLLKEKERYINLKLYNTILHDEKIDEKSFINSNLMPYYGRKLILNSETIEVEEIINIGEIIIDKFKIWFMQSFLDGLILFTGDYLEEITEWWHTDGIEFIALLNKLSLPKTLAGLHDEILLLQFHVNTVYNYENIIDGLISITDLLEYEWQLMATRLPFYER